MTTPQNGIITTDISGLGSEDYLFSVTLQPDGKIIAAGASDGNFALVRYNSNGSLDTSFDSDGKIITDFGSSDDSAYSIILQPDGKLVAAGSSSGFTVARYNTDGSLDTSFSEDGKVITSIDVSSSAYSLTLQFDGKLVVVGHSQNRQSPVSSFDSDFAVVRYNADGSLDTSFSDDGKVVTGIITTAFDSSNRDDDQASAHSVFLLPDGKLLVMGDSRWGGAFVRFNSDGSLDSSFGFNGRVTTSNTPSRSPIFQINGKIVAVGSTENHDF